MAHAGSQNCFPPEYLVHGSTEIHLLGVEQHQEQWENNMSIVYRQLALCKTGVMKMNFPQWLVHEMFNFTTHEPNADWIW